MPQSLETSRDGRVLRLKMNRPEKRNALNYDLCRNLVEAMESAESDAAVGAILLRGEGPSFCAGMDLEEILTPADEAIGAIHERLFTIGSRVFKPIIAAVDGAALAGGVGLLANAHIVVASEISTFGLTEIRIGLWPFLIFRAVSLAIGERRTVELTVTGRIFHAAEAREIGLVHHIGPLERAEELAAAAAAMSPEALRAGLQFVDEIRGQAWPVAGAASIRYRNELFRSARFQEGVRDFRAKRRLHETSR